VRSIPSRSLYVNKFRVLQGEGKTLVEINDEARIVATTPVKRAVRAGTEPDAPCGRRIGSLASVLPLP
jgi:hypothetical protein